MHEARLRQLDSIEKALKDNEDIVMRIGKAKLTLRPKSDDGKYQGTGHGEIRRAILRMCKTDRDTIAAEEAETVKATQAAP
jgi:hypothetical protein